jgi:hypothetical protein
MTQSQTAWFRRLAAARFKNGRWVPGESFAAGDDPFASLQDDVLSSVNLFNQHAKTPIRLLDPAPGSDAIATLIHGSAQLRFVRRGQFLDISLMRTHNYEMIEQPLVRFAPGHDCLGCVSWRRGATEISSEQVIKNALIQLLEASSAI